MSVEARRGCGFRKVGALYMVSGALGEECHRLPIPLIVCPCCGQGIKQTRGWTWIEPKKLLVIQKGRKEDVCNHHSREITHCDICPVCKPEKLGDRAGLLWIGEKFYATPRDFVAEGASLGISRRIKAIPRGFKLGESWVLLAHPKAITKEISDKKKRSPSDLITAESIPGIFQVFKPERIETLITKSSATKAKLEELKKKGITPIIVPDDDKDHQGTVYDKEDSEN